MWDCNLIWPVWGICIVSDERVPSIHRPVNSMIDEQFCTEDYLGNAGVLYELDMYATATLHLMST